MEVDVAFTGIAVTSLAAARDPYSRLFGRDADIVASDQEVMWRLTDSAWLYVVVDAHRAGRSLVTMAVSDLDVVVAELESRGVDAGPIEVIPDAGRKATWRDPDGNTVAFVEVLGGGSDPGERESSP
jgi:hypothetical protein